MKVCLECEVEVKYVDFGNTAKITLKDMRKIKDEFLNPCREGNLLTVNHRFRNVSTNIMKVFLVIFTIEMLF